MEILMPFLTTILVQLPVLLVWLAGVALAIIFWQRHPRVSLLTTIAVALLLLDTLLNGFLNVGVPLWFSRAGISVTQIAIFFTIKSILTSIVAAIAWGLLLAAIFGRRKPTSTEPTAR